MSDLIRSALYLPAANPRALAKARTLACDAVILDLEDAVAPEEKEAARAAAVAAVREGGFGHRRVVVRVNALDTPWGADDLAALRGVHVDAVLAPKVSSAAGVRRYAGELAPNRDLWIMVETCRSVFALEPLAATSADTPLTTFVLGFNDLAKEMRLALSADRAPLLPFLSFAVAAARAHCLAVLDGVYNTIDDAAGFAAACRQSVAWGCDGRTLIHPSQITACNAAFAPGAADVDAARAIVAAFDDPANAGRGALRVGGAMAERLHLGEARRLLDLAARCAERDGAEPLSA